jgi:hypothetical protein
MVNEVVQVEPRHHPTRRGEEHLVTLLEGPQHGEVRVLGRREGLAGSWPNGMKSTSERLLDQLLAQFLAGFNHEREALGATLFDPWLCPMRADGVDDQGP